MPQTLRYYPNAQIRQGVTRVYAIFRFDDSRSSCPSQPLHCRNKADIIRERVIIEHALDAGYPSEVAESMLHTLEGALRMFEKHRELVRAQLKRRPSV